jgi:hypothetical protein
MAEARRILAEAERRGVAVRFFGGVSVALRSPSAQLPGLQRTYNDLDLAGSSRERREIEKLCAELEYEPARSFNALRGHERLLFADPRSSRQVDVMLDRFRMCHVIDFKGRLLVDKHTLPLAELLLFKLQIVETNQKDLTDSITLLGDHPLGERDGDTINAAYIARLTGDDWGMYHTIELSLGRVATHARTLALDLPYPIEDQVTRLREYMERRPKSTRWKLRARVGERVRWYELPEEARD